MTDQSEVHVEGEIAAPIADVWKVVGDFAELLRVQKLPTTVEGEGIGMIRRVQMGPAVIVERLESHDDASYTTVYSIVEGPIPVTDYRATITLESVTDDTTKINWTTTFQPAGIPESDACKMLEGAYGSGIKAIQKHFAAAAD